MKIAVIGAGIIGITTAWELTQDGHEVTVLERRGAAAEESSFANAGVVAPGYVTPWAAPGMPWKVAKHLIQGHAPVTLGPRAFGQDLPWIIRWLRACNAKTYALNRTHMQVLARYSRERLRHVAGTAGLEFERAQGYTVLLRSTADRKMVQPSLQVLRDADVPFVELDEAGTRLVEPALNPDMRFHGAIHLAEDEVGNCRQFALLLKGAAINQGTRFEFNTEVTKVHAVLQGVELQIAKQPARVQFDACVVCVGVEAAHLLRPLGIKLPLAAVYGYSVSAHVREPLNAPRSGVMDERYKIAISRLGQRVRVAGSAELGGSAGRMNPAALNTLYKVLQDWFPGAAVLSQGIQQWKGARPMLPDGPPVVGLCQTPGVWLNLGHGSSGWALSCGCARALADTIAGRAPAIDLARFSVERFN